MIPTFIDEAHAAMVRALALLISDLSEEAWCASWCHGVEFEVWAQIHNASKHSMGDADTLTDDERAFFRLFSEAIGGWVMWREGPTHCVRDGAHSDFGGVVFVERDDWIRIYEKETGHKI